MVRPVDMVTRISTLKRPFGRPRRSTGAVTRLPLRVATSLPSTLTVARRMSDGDLAPDQVAVGLEAAGAHLAQGPVRERDHERPVGQRGDVGVAVHTCVRPH
jgi:hypothetical protein